jgi:hypothetical protein
MTKNKYLIGACGYTVGLVWSVLMMLLLISWLNIHAMFFLITALISVLGLKWNYNKYWEQTPYMEGSYDA